jgi:hypothetical protein
MIYLPDPQYNPVHAKELNTHTLLQKGTTISKFIKNTGKFYDYNNKSYNVRLQVAKHLYLHSEFMKVVNKPGGMFDKFRLVVSEGLYEKESGETVSSNSITSYRTTGKAIVYELYDQYGNLAVESTFDLVNYLRIASRYDKLILSYDTFTGNSLHASIIAIMPTLSANSSWNVTFKYDLETQYNNIKQSSNEIVEIRV